MSTPALVHVIDDDASMRASLLELLKAAGFHARGYETADEFLRSRTMDQHGCIVLDVRLQGASGVEVQQQIAQRKIDLPVIFLTGHADIGTSVRAMKAGAVDFLEKPVRQEVLFEVLARALSLDLARRASRSPRTEHAARLATLTPRECAVFDLIVTGKRNKQIADDLGITLRTVKSYRAQLMGKLGVATAAQLGRFAGESEAG